jgi:hypothetical protein
VLASCLSGPLEDLPPSWRPSKARCLATTATLTRYGTRSAVGGETRKEMCWVALLVGGWVCPVTSAQC